MLSFAESSYSRDNSQSGKTKQQQQLEYNDAKARCLDTLPGNFIAQWSRTKSSAATEWPSDYDNFKNLIDVTRLISSVNSYVRIISNNYQLRAYFGSWHKLLSSYSKWPIVYPTDGSKRPPYIPKEIISSITNQSIFQNSAPPHAIQEYQKSADFTGASKVEISPKFNLLIESLRQNVHGSHQSSYVLNLEQSMEALMEVPVGHYLTRSRQDLKSLLEVNRRIAQVTNDQLLHRIRAALSCIDGESKSKLSLLTAEALVPRLPRIGSRFLLQQLLSLESLPSEWKTCLLTFATCLSRLQLWERLLRSMVETHGDPIKESHGLQPRTWDPLLFPNWLVFEVENNLRIRNVQAEISQAMICPPSNMNSVLQLNMGDGKSSVIVPIIATTLADGKTLVRVMVAKPQSKQMADILASRIGGILNRQVYFLPFTRSISLQESTATQLQDMVQECIANQGVLLVQPEHVLSLQLMMVDCFISSRIAEGKILCSILQLFKTSSRDIIDESDENFCPKYELVYPLGIPQPVDFPRERCCLIQEILGKAVKMAMKIKMEAPNGIEVVSRNPGRYPRIRIFTAQSSKRLVRYIGQEICLKGLIGCPLHRVHEYLKREFLSYITEKSPKIETVKLIQTAVLHWDSGMKKAINLVRGMLAFGVLGAAFQHRFCVDYGLDTTRTPNTDLAVPYRAKDTPSLRSEYSYADTIITKTCLSWYYKGLDYQNLMLTLTHLLKSEQSDVEYRLWTRDAPTLPIGFHYIESINLYDKEQCKNILLPHLRFSKGCIDYFLSHIVFPKQLREYSEQVSASGWDLGCPKTLPTTGFSGTHDSRHLLPLHVTQSDLRSQKHTDALVLNNMLSPDNTIVALEAPRFDNEAEEFLQIIVSESREIRVILDVGAHVIELTNQQVAQKWLDLLYWRQQDIHAAIFCNEKDEIMVLDRQGQVQSLRVSPLAQQLDKCVVYLDQAHTRGIDLNLPATFRAAVTLGKDLTKDRLAQGRFSL